MEAKIKKIRVNGYKNLIDCKFDLENFNVIVGPNNSGKSNLFELFDFMYFLLFGNEDMRKNLLRGIDYGRFSSTISHLNNIKKDTLTLGFELEVPYMEDVWDVGYEFEIKYGKKEDEKAGFVCEILQAKKIQEPAKPGGPKTYFKREIEAENQVLKIKEKDKNRVQIHKIERANPSFSAIKSLYPDSEGLPNELNAFISAIRLISFSSVCAVSPINMREKLHQEEEYTYRKGVGYDLELELDKLKSESPANYELLKDRMCDIMNFEKIRLWSKTINLEGKNKQQVIRRVFITMNNNENMIDEFSDGTFAVMAILLALLSEKHVGAVILIEEPENFLHPRALNKLLSFLQECSTKRQIILSTHSPYLLNGIKPTDAHVAIVNDKTGATHFEKIKDSKELRNYLKTGLMGFGDLLVSNFEEVLGAN